MTGCIALHASQRSDSGSTQSNDDKKILGHSNKILGQINDDLLKHRNKSIEEKSRALRNVNRGQHLPMEWNFLGESMTAAEEM